MKFLYLTPFLFAFASAAHLGQLKTESVKSLAKSASEVKGEHSQKIHELHKKDGPSELDGPGAIDPRAGRYDHYGHTGNNNNYSKPIINQLIIIGHSDRPKGQRRTGYSRVNRNAEQQMSKEKSEQIESLVESMSVISNQEPNQNQVKYGESQGSYRSGKQDHYGHNGNNNNVDKAITNQLILIGYPDLLNGLQSGAAGPGSASRGGQRLDPHHQQKLTQLGTRSKFSDIQKAKSEAYEAETVNHHGYSGDHNSKNKPIMNQFVLFLSPNKGGNGQGRGSQFKRMVEHKNAPRA